MTGRVLDRRYLVGDRIARGGMASVYSATDLRLDRVVAVKIMHPGLGDDTEFAARFVGEARAAARLSHPNVVAVYDQGEDDGTVFLAMELISGHTLRDAIAQRSPLPPIHAVALLAPVVDALASAHTAGLIHRDVKPENVLIAEDGRIKVADFGLAKAMSSMTQHTATGMLIGTVSYVAPEIVTEGRSDARGDVYAVGVILYELLTGLKPHAGESPIQIAYKHVHHDVPAPSATVPGIPPYVDALVARATSRDPGLRPADARVLKHQLEQVRSALAAGLADDPGLTADLSLRPTTRPDPGRDQRVDAPHPDDTQEVPREDTVQRPRSEPAPPPLAAAAAAVDEDPWEHSALKDLFGPSGSSAPHGAELYDDLHQAPHQGSHQHPEARERDREVTSHFPRATTAATGTQVRSAARPTAGPPTSPGSPRRPRKPRRSRRGPILLALALLVASAVGVGAWWFGYARYTVTPAVLGLDQAAAQTKLDAVGLTSDIGTPTYSDTVPEGRVVSTDPGPGGKVLDGGTVQVVLSLGVEKYDVPVLTGLDEDQAQDQLAATKLTFGTSTQQFSEDVPAGTVLASDPAAGRTVRPGTVVDLTVSKGRKPVRVGSWVGTSAATADAKLRKRGLVVDAGDREFSDTVPEGVVISQSPTEGTLFLGETVTLVVSQGPELVEVPGGLIASGVESATATLQAAGFQVEVENSDQYLGLGYVLSTSPDSGDMVPQGSVIVLYLI